MSDIAERLRLHANQMTLQADLMWGDCGDGADEIERLRAEIKELKETLKWLGKGFDE